MAMVRWFLFLIAFPVLASDLQREQRWADEIVDAILVGDPEYLKAGDHEFLSIYTEPEGDANHGAVILVHGIGVHPDWSDVINPLREQLPESGWATLSIQMPVLDAEADVPEYYPIFPEALPRLDAAIGFLREQGYKKVVVVGHSLGSQMGAYWVSQSKDAELAGFGAIGMSGAKRSGHGSTLDYLKNITVPTADIYGEFDLRTVNKTLEAKAAAAKQAGNPAFTQIEVKGADHMFQGFDDPLVEAVQGWLEGLQ